MRSLDARILILLLPLTAACHISDAGTKLGVPFRMQQSDLTCGPTCVLMWALYSGVPSTQVSESGIARSMPNGSCNGSAPAAIAMAVNQWTYTTDAYDDLAGNVSPEQDKFLSRQITSIDNGVPVIALVNGGLHAVILDGGKWHTDTTTNLRVWDFSYVNDPERPFGDFQENAPMWVSDVCFSVCRQEISRSASGAWQGNLSTYGAGVVLGGSGGRTGGPLPKIERQP